MFSVTLPDKLHRQRMRLMRQSWRNMRRLDTRNIPSTRDEFRLFCFLRNEELRLPYFLAYYRRMGIERFTFIDNMSTDGTVDLLLSEPDVHVLQTDEHYDAHGVWQNVLLRKFGMDRWSIFADVDELFMYPYMEQLSLRAFVRYLDEHAYTAIHAVLVDMYGSGTTSETVYRQGQDVFEATPYLDPPDFEERAYRSRRAETFPDRILCGGTRMRMFGVDVCSSKIPLLKYGRRMYLNGGHHTVERARLADLRGAVMHTTFLNDTIKKAQYEAARGVHWQNATVYKAFANVLEAKGDVSPYHRESIKFRSTGELVERGVMHVSQAYLRFAEMNQLG